MCLLFNKQKLKLPHVTVKIGCHWERVENYLSLNKLWVGLRETCCWVDWMERATVNIGGTIPTAGVLNCVKRRLWAEHRPSAISASWLRTWDLPPCPPASMLLCSHGLYPWNMSEKSNRYAIGPSKFCSICIPKRIGRVPLLVAIKCLVGGEEAVLLSDVAPCRLPCSGK